jgi:GT2 family glycosyltransferase
MTDLDIVIVSYNARADLERCLASLQEARPRTPSRIVVVDNGSRDGSPEAARASGREVMVMALEENVGFARANNLAIRATSSPLILLLNSDTIVPPGALDRLVATLRNDPGAAIAGPRLVDGDGRPELSFGRMLTPWAEWHQRRLVRGLDGNRPSVVAHVDRITRIPRYADWVSGACLLVRRADAESVGLLDERYFMYLEDVDFCAALRARGRRIRFDPSVEIVHLRGRSRQAAPARTQQAYRRSHLAFYRKHHPFWAPLLGLYLRLRGERVDAVP